MIKINYNSKCILNIVTWAETNAAFQIFKEFTIYRWHCVKL